MSTSHSSTGPVRTPSMGQRQTPLFRGTGCHHCRTRKVRCDAAKPFCTRCVAQGTTDKCKYDEVKKSKLTLIKEENAELKERVARLERRLAGDTSLSLSPSPVPSPEDVKYPPSSLFSQLQLAESEHEDDIEDEVKMMHGEPGGSGPAPNEFLSYSQHPSSLTNYPAPAEHFQTAPSQEHPRSTLYRQAQFSPPPETAPTRYQPHLGQRQSSYESYSSSNDPYYAQQGHSADNVFRTGGLAPIERYAPQTGYGTSFAGGYEPSAQPWSSTAHEQQFPASASSASSFTPSPSGDRWQQLPYLSPVTTPASPGGTTYQSSRDYFQGATFGSYGTYRGGAMPSYDVYQGAPNRQAALVTRRRPIPSPPVFGNDVVMTFFQKWRSEYQEPAYVEQEYSRVQTSYDGNSWALVGNWWERDDLSSNHRNYLLEIFLPFRKQVGLELWVPDFLASLHLPPKGRPHPGFMWMIYSFAATFSGDPELQALVPEFMERARRNLAESLASNDRLFDYIRGQTLYATMLYVQGRINEGYLASSAACNAAILCGLHKISSPVCAQHAQSGERSVYRIRHINFQLEPASCPREHGERVAAFWQLILVDHAAASATGLPAMFRDDGDERSRVETVFPRPLEEYINGKAAESPYATMHDIFSPRFIPNPPDTIGTLQVKATALLERTVRLATTWKSGNHISTTNPEKYMAEYHTVLSAIRHFRSYLPSLTCKDTEGPESQLSRTSMGLISERLYPHFIVMNAQIQLYNILEETSPVAYDSCLKSAQDIAALISQLNDLEIAQLGVMMGTCFTSASHVFLRELKHCRERQDEGGIVRIDQELDVVHHAMAVLGQQHHLVSVQSSLADRSRFQEVPILPTTHASA